MLLFIQKYRYIASFPFYFFPPFTLYACLPPFLYLFSSIIAYISVIPFLLFTAVLNLFSYFINVYQKLDN